ncbi:MAG: putative aminohydrolase SsnA [Spartobacteria bacterium]|nr:putative aminohydrolase SsnA [Spartobacteria bacterium]
MAKKEQVLLIGNGTLITLGEANRIIQDGAVLIRDGVIEAVGKTATLRKKARGATYINAKGKLIMPGFVNTHMHFYSTFARGLCPKQPAAKNFVEILDRLWFPLDKTLNADDIYYSTLVPLISAIKSGTTTMIDHHESQGFQLGSLDVIEKAVRKVGIRGCLTLGASDRYKKGQDGVEENVRFLKKIQAKNRKGDDMVTGMMGLHALFTVNEDTLKVTCDLAKAFNTGVHVHIAEDKADEDFNKKKYKKTVVQRLYDAGGLGPKTLAIHCVHINKAEMNLLAKTDTCVVTNPQSNMNNAVGVAPLLDMLEKGILVGLGTDAMTPGMVDDVRVVNILQKLANKDPRVFFVESCNLLLNNNGTIASRFFQKPVGVLKKGAYGDVILVDYDPPTPLNGNTFLGHFLFGICGARVDTTVVNGKILMQEGKLKGLNESAIMAASRKQAAAFWKRF